MASTQYEVARTGLLGYHVTLVRGATTAWNHEMLHAAHELNGHTYAHVIFGTDELVTAIIV
jgi:nicotinamidase-related amidase